MAEIYKKNICGQMLEMLGGGDYLAIFYYSHKFFTK